MTESFWKKCNSCKKPIAFKAVYWVCNVSTCNRKRLGLSFCSVSCWDAHLPLMNHRESWAEERRAPSEEEWQRTLSGADDVPRSRAPKVKPAEPQAAVAAQTPAPVRTILRKNRE